MTNIYDDAQAFYVEQLRRCDGAQDYLGSRGLSPDLAARLGLGYGGSDWRGLLDHLNAKGWSDDAVRAAGLAFRHPTRGSTLDRCRGRVTFPVRDEDRRLVGFVGRDLSGTSGMKYVEAGADGVKRRVLQGLGDGRHLLEQGGVPVLTEGPLDRLGVTIATGGQYVGLAPGGTALTGEHVATLERTVGLQGRRVVVAFDCDGPGQQAALRAYPLLRAAGAVPDLAVLPPGSDPAQLAVDNPSRLLAALERARPLEDAVVDQVLARWSEQTHWAEGISGALGDAARVVVDLPPDRVARQVARLSTALAVPPSTVTGAVCDVLDAAGPVARARAPGLALRAG